MIRKEYPKPRAKQPRPLFPHPCHISGRVIAGKRLGRSLGFPTANIAYGSQALPGNGVYCALTYLDGVFYPSMANVGLNPTVDKDGRKKLEVHILNFDHDIYDRQVTVYFLDFIRREHRFASVEQLSEQLKKDRETTLSMFAQF